MGEPAHSSLVDEVHLRSGGNPYFARLLVDGLAPTATHLPERLPEALSTAAVRSWDALGVEARRLLVALAVGGRPASGRALSRVADVADVADAGPVLAEAVDAGMLDVAADGALWFHHPLQAEVLEASLPAADREVLHAGFATGYEDDAEDGLTPELAETISDHHLLAGQRDPAYHWAVTAADLMDARADRVGTLRMLRRAADLHPHARAPAVPLDVILDGVREAARAVGSWEAELAAVDALLELVDREADPRRVAALLAWRGFLRFRMGLGETLADLEPAVRLSEAGPTSWHRVLVLSEYSRMLMWGDDKEQARHVVRELADLVDDDDVAARAMREEAGEWARARAFALTQRLMLATFEEDSSLAAALGPAAIEAAASSGDGALMSHAVLWHANARGDMGLDWARTVDRGARLMEDRGMPQRYAGWLSAAVVDNFWMFGEVETCRTRLRVALGSDAGPTGNHLARAAAAVLAASEGRQEEADAHLARAWEVVEDPLSYLDLPAAFATAHVLVHRGDAEGAFDIARRGMTRAGARPTRCEWLAPLAARAVADLVRADLDAGRDPAEHRRRLEDLRADFPQVLRDAGLPSGVYQGQLDALQALYDAEATRAGLEADAPERWCRAAELLATAGFAWDEAYACRRAGEALLGHGGADERRRAAALLRRGHALAERLGAVPVRDAIEALAPLGPHPARRGAGPAGPGRPAGRRRAGVSLTRREREVLDHVVAGRTYAEIAGALFLSEKTVSSHISNILRKTGTANRVELAAWAGRVRHP